jgi:hypothetical protein
MAERDGRSVRSSDRTHGHDSARGLGDLLRLDSRSDCRAVKPILDDFVEARNPENSTVPEVSIN